MVLLYRSDRFREHDTGPHPERALRLARVEGRLDASRLADRCTGPDWEPVSDEVLAAIHPSAYTEKVRRIAREGGGPLDPDTVVSPASYDVARLAAGAACDAVRRVARGDDSRALCLIRPPGHHALAERAMGFCLLNNVAVAARLATRELGLDRVLIVDWDVHHGNGTQDLFWEDPQVGYFSIHRWPFYPGTGRADESGSGRGLATTCNLPVAMGTSRDEYRDLFTRELEDFAARIRPQLVLISAGFDSHREDPIGSLGLETEDFQPLTRAVLEVAASHAAGRVVSVLEGGYHPDRLAECVELHLETLLEGET